MKQKEILCINPMPFLFIKYVLPNIYKEREESTVFSSQVKYEIETKTMFISN
jgi:hypothetical protein